MASTEPGAKAIITSAPCSDSSLTRPTANTAAIATATANEPKAAARKFASSRSGILAKRAPITRAERDHGGVGDPPRHHRMESARCHAARPRRTWRRTAGRRESARDRRSMPPTVEAATRIASSPSTARVNGPLPRRGTLPTSPSSDKPGRQADRDDDHAHALHDGDRAQVGAELGGERQHLRHPARRGREIGRQ